MAPPLCTTSPCVSGLFISAASSAVQSLLHFISALQLPNILARATKSTLCADATVAAACVRASVCTVSVLNFYVLSLSKVFKSSARVSVAVQGGHDPAGRGAEGCALRSSHEPFILGVRL